MIIKKLRELRDIKFVRSIGILVGGTAFSQLLALIVLPLLTRIYTPEDFTILATYASLLAILTSIACLRFEIGIPIPEENESAIYLFFLSIISVIIISSLTFFIVAIGANWINSVTNNLLNGYLWLLPLGAFFSGSYNALQYWMTRDRAFSLIAKTRVKQALASSSVQLGAGWVGIMPLGLLLGHLLSSCAGIISLLNVFLKEFKSLSFKFKFSKLIDTLKTYDRFPKYSTWEALTNSAGAQVPILIIATYALGPEAGFLMLAMRLISAPMTLVGRAVGQVYLAEAAQKYHKGELRLFTTKTIVMLAKVGFIPLLLACVTAPTLVPIVFGSGWERTGVLISWMAPWFFIQFITSPVSMSLHITNNQHVAMMLQISGVLIRCISIWIAVNFFNEFVGEIYAISGFIFYLLYLGVVFFTVKDNSRSRNL
ncbi:oligosaccharide flippase family protein [Pseudoalteromonas sp. Z1A8]|uniref:lipopolysaccharide biosynthesis protein n=1 Tax=Pseudoalteromonas sp. Z1A8 TaxID=2686354 RepID=UPI00140DB03A|nr:oligosaccharide flippase family protein [Pseudoalteromonas sp. Z1A8]